MIFASFFSSKNSAARNISIASAFALMAAAAVLACVVFAAVITPGDPRRNPGDFLLNAYGLFSFLIPAWFVWAATILWSPVYSPRSIFALDMSAIPFFSLAGGFSVTRNYERFAETIPFLAVLGRGGFSFTIVIFTVMEAAVIAILSQTFFPKTEIRRKENRGREQNRRQEKSTPSRNIVNFTADKKETPKAGADAPFEVIRTPVLLGEIALRKPEPPDLIEEIALDNGSWELEIENLTSSFSHLAEFDTQTLDTEFCETLSPETFEPEAIDFEIKSSAPYKPEMDELEIIEPEINELETDVLKTENKIESLKVNLPESFSQLEEEFEPPITEEADLSNFNPEPSGAIKLEPINPELYDIPTDILKEYPDGEYWVIDDATRIAAKALTSTLSEFNIEADVTGIRKGPVITMFEVLPAPGVKLSRIVNLQDNIAMRLAAASVRIVAPIPGKQAVGIEIPNAKRNIVSFRELIESERRRWGGGSAKQNGIPVVLGKDIAGDAVTIDLSTMPHLLIAGSTGSGKSVCVNTIILSILYQCHPAQCKLILIDPKIVELNLYNDIPHLLAPVITEPKKALQALQYCICEMERRYSCLDSVHVRDIRSYNERIKEQNLAAENMPYLVVVIDEFADLMATTGKELENAVARLTAKSRAVGIHLVLATQRPSTDVITGLIKSNVPGRIAFMVASQIDSRIIIDTTGAEKLLGKGDMLYSGIVSPFPVRMQGAFVSEAEVDRVVQCVKNFGAPEYIEDEIFFDDDESGGNLDGLIDGAEDPLFEKATEIVVQQGKASASYIQRRLKIGYNRAARLVELMEAKGIVGPAQGAKPRELLRAV